MIATVGFVAADPDVLLELDVDHDVARVGVGVVALVPSGDR